MWSCVSSWGAGSMAFSGSMLASHGKWPPGLPGLWKANWSHLWVFSWWSLLKPLATVTHHLISQALVGPASLPGWLGLLPVAAAARDASKCLSYALSTPWPRLRLSWALPWNHLIFHHCWPYDSHSVLSAAAFMFLISMRLVLRPIHNKETEVDSVRLNSGFPSV